MSVRIVLTDGTTIDRMDGEGIRYFARSDVDADTVTIHRSERGIGDDFKHAGVDAVFDARDYRSFYNYD